MTYEVDFRFVVDGETNQGRVSGDLRTVFLVLQSLERYNPNIRYKDKEVGWTAWHPLVTTKLKRAA